MSTMNLSTSLRRERHLCDPRGTRSSAGPYVTASDMWYTHGSDFTELLISLHQADPESWGERPSTTKNGDFLMGLTYKRYKELVAALRAKDIEEHPGLEELEQKSTKEQDEEE